MPGSARQQLCDLERHLYEARQQLINLKGNARALARLQQEIKCAACVLQEDRPQKKSMPAEMEIRSSVDVSKKSARTQIRRQHGVRPQALHFTGREGEAVLLDGISSNSDGLLLAVDKFLSTVDSQHVRASTK